MRFRGGGVEVGANMFGYIVDLAAALAVASKDDRRRVNDAAGFFEDDARSIDAVCHVVES